MIHVTVWNEFRHEKTNETVQKMYPEGIHGQIAKFLEEDDFQVRTATLDEPEHGLT
ncbi:trehalose utilization protein ThuA, partial [Escherichia coli]